MKPSCVIKSHPKGLSLIMDPDTDFKKLVEDICLLFARSKEFFGSDNLVLSMEGRTLSPEETLVVIEAIELNSNIKVPLILDEDGLRDARMTGHIERYFFERSEKYARIIKGNVEPGDSVRSETGLAIAGDLKRGGEVSCDGNIMVFGDLGGKAHAGCDGNESAFIVAGTVTADSVTIAGHTGACEIRKKRILGRKDKPEPVVIRLLNGHIVSEPLSGGLIKQK